LPNVWNLGSSMERTGKNLFRFNAAHCDMIAALTCFPAAGAAGSSPVVAPPGSPASLMPALAEGGAALLEFLEQATREHPVDLVGAIIEVF
jgi:hypothetical protein